MTTLKFESKNPEIAVAFGGTVETDKNGKQVITSAGKLADNKPRCYTIDFTQKTTGGMVPVGFIQVLDDVPSRGAGSNDAFEASNKIADLFGTNNFSSGVNIYRSRELFNEETAKKLAEKVGQVIPELDNFSLIVEDSVEPTYEDQSTSQKDGEDRLSNGAPFYTTIRLREKGTVAHSVFTLDKIAVETQQLTAPVSESNGKF